MFLGFGNGPNRMKSNSANVRKY